MLIIDDDLATWKPRLESIFTLPNWQLVYAASVEEARARFAEHWDTDLVMVDFVLSDGTGRDVLEFVRALDENVPVVLFSERSEGGFSAHDMARFAPVCTYVDKNRSFDNLDELLDEVTVAFTEYMAGMCTPRVFSETGQLRVVLIHTPGEEVNRIDPFHLPEYLFESRPELGNMEEQHRGFLRVLKDHGKRPITLDTAQLLYEVLRDADEERRIRIIEQVLLHPEIDDARRVFTRQGLAFSPLLDERIAALAGEDALALTRTLLAGWVVTPSGPNSTASVRFEDQFVLPVPNLYFTRDPGFVLGDTMVLSRMHWPIRRREVAILRNVIRYHPFMRAVKSNLIDDGLDDPSHLFSIEGGDVMAIGHGIYAAAESERTRRQSIRRLAHALFQDDDDTQLVYQPVIPARRAFIHLDTVCSIAGEDFAVVHPEAVDAYPNTLVWTREVVERGLEPISLNRSFTEVLEDECKKRLIQTAGGGALANLEQFDDATNVFMVDPKTAVAYDRNRVTNSILREHGVQVAEFRGSDLVMGRGGPRCMTMPLNRD